METDAKKDNRNLSIAEKNQPGRSIVRLHRKGLKGVEMVDLLGVNKNTVVTVTALYREGGMQAVLLRDPGRRSGRGRSPSPQQEKAVREMIRDRRPEQLKLDFALWNREAVRLLIEQKFGITLCVRAVGNYLSRWGFTPQKPLKRAYGQQPAAVQQWLDGECPAIAQQAKDEGAEIYWGDRTAIRNTDVQMRGHAPRGRTPELRVHTKRERVSMMSAVNNRGKVSWMLTDGSFNADRVIEFMDALIRDSTSKVYLILDNLRVHHSKPVKEWIEANSDRISVFHLPSYSPELNPDEQLNADLKNVLRKKAPVSKGKVMKQAVDGHLSALKADPERVRKFFMAEPVRYAA